MEVTFVLVKMLWLLLNNKICKSL